MHVNVLGPLEVVGDDGVLSIGGPKKRAALGYLVLQANGVVATSHLIKAIWPGNAPSTARKMVQNAVSGIRAMLAEHDRDGSFALLTHSPGYLLRADEAQVDVLRFERLASAGRQALANGAWAEAAQALDSACRLWRGAALADLSDAGITWPKLDALREARRSTMEDFFEAGLAEGRHHDLLAELDRLAAAQPHRERACRLLMLALYRCGRQVDALDVFARTEAALQARSGLAPTRELRDMEQAILRQDNALQAPHRPALVRVVPQPGSERPAALLDPGVAAVSERKLISILTVAFDLPDVADHEEADDLLAELGRQVRTDVVSAGATVLGSTGASLQAVFGVPRTDEHDALTAVRTAVAIRDRFAAVAEVRVSVHTIHGLVTLSQGAPEVVSPEIDRCLRTIGTLPPAQVWVCEATRRGSGQDVVFAHLPGGPVLWCARELRCTDPSIVDILGWRFVEREHELAVLGEHVDVVLRCGRGRPVTVLGPAGTGKTRLVLELVRLLRSRQAGVRVVGTIIRRHACHADALAALLADCCPALASTTTLASDIAGLVGAGELADSLTRGLLPLVGQRRADATDAALRAAGAALVELITALVVADPLVLLVEDLHNADDELIALFGSLAARVSSIPLLLVCTARPDPVEQGRACLPSSTTMVLEPLSDDAVRVLWSSVVGTGPDQVASPAPGVNARIHGNPLFAIEFALQHLHNPIAAHRTALPARVYRAVAAELDALPHAEKQVLKDATLVSGPVLAAEVAAVAGRDPADVEGCLANLAHRRLLHRCGEGGCYEFASPLVREVAHAQLPKSARARASASSTSSAVLPRASTR